jgi:hypothetical protein
MVQRQIDHRRQVWRGARSGSLDFVHAPHLATGALANH